MALNIHAHIQRYPLTNGEKDPRVVRMKKVLSELEKDGGGVPEVLEARRALNTLLGKVPRAPSRREEELGNEILRMRETMAKLEAEHTQAVEAFERERQKASSAHDGRIDESMRRIQELERAQQALQQSVEEQQARLIAHFNGLIHKQQQDLVQKIAQGSVSPELATAVAVIQQQVEALRQDVARVDSKADKVRGDLEARITETVSEIQRAVNATKAWIDTTAENAKAGDAAIRGDLERMGRQLMQFGRDINALQEMRARNPGAGAGEGAGAGGFGPKAGTQSRSPPAGKGAMDEEDSDI